MQLNRAFIQILAQQKILQTLNDNLNKLPACIIGTKKLTRLIQTIINGHNGSLLQMFKAGLAYETNFPINWCPSCMTGLANEEVVRGACERCGTPGHQEKYSSMDAQNY